jgi:subtilisin family serine protease
MPIRVLDQNGEGELWRIQAAILWAANHGVDIVNMSMSYPNEIALQNNEVMKNLMDYCGTGLTDTGKIYPEAGNKRLIFVVGAGNGGNDVPVYPAALRSVDTKIAVAASTRYDKLATFSTINRKSQGSGSLEWVKAVAPGEDIISAIPGGRYGSWSGTSMATPVVAGVVALARSRNENLNPVLFVEQFEETGYEWECFLPSRGYTIDTARVDALCGVLGQECGDAPVNPCQ